jgi:flagellin FlaB
MVLVAAIAAGVLINTAGLLQAQAQQTGAETTSEVSDILEVGSVVGEASTTSPANITKINASLKLSAGSDPINVSEASYTLANSRNATIVNGNPNVETGIKYVLRQGVKDTSTTISDQGDFIVIQFNLTNISGIDPIEPGSQVTIITESPAGGQSYTQARAPELIDPSNSYVL